MTRARAAAATALIAALTLTGCGIAEGAEASSTAATTASVETPGRGWLTFGEATSSTDFTRSTPRLTTYGTFLIESARDVEGQEIQGSQVVLRGRDGEVWRSETFTVPEGVAVRSSLVSLGERDWFVVWFQVSDTEMSVQTFDPQGAGGDGKAPIHTERIVGQDGGLPTITATARGILVSKAQDSGPFMYWPQDGARTAFGGDLAQGEVLATPAWAYGAGFIFYYPGGGFGYGGQDGGWDTSRTSTHPEGGDPATAIPVNVAGGVLASVWTGPEGRMLVVNDILTGNYLGQVPEDQAQAFEDVEGAPVVAGDGSWLAWGGYTVNLDGRGDLSTFRALPGATPTAIYQDAVYYSGAERVPGARTGSDSFDGFLALDAATGIVVDAQAQAALVGVRPDGLGALVFTDDDSTTATLVYVAARDH